MNQLQIELIDDQGRPLILQGRRVLVRDGRTKTPLAVVALLGDGIIETAIARDGNEFNRTLRQLGIGENVLVTTIDKNLQRIII